MKTNIDALLLEAPRLLDSSPGNVNNIILVLGENTLSTTNRFANRYPNLHFHTITFESQEKFSAEKFQRNVTCKSVKTVAQARHAAAQINGVHAIVDNSMASQINRVDLLRELFYFLDDGGVFAAVAAMPNHGLLQNAATNESLVFDLLHQAIRAKAPASSIKLTNQDKHLSSAILRLEDFGAFCLAYKTGTHFYKVRDHDANEVLNARYGESWGTVVTTIEGGTHTSKSEVWTNKKNLAYRFPKEIKYPESSHRVYERPAIYPGQVVTHDSLILPDTFRHLLGKSLINKNLTNVSDHFVVAPNDSRIQENFLRGTYFYLDTEYPGVYGHVTTEIISRLWAWNAAKSLHPNLKVLVAPKAGQLDIPRYERHILSGYGIIDEDIYLVTEPTIVEKLVAATPMFSNPKFVNPAILPVWNTIRDSLRTNNEKTSPRKVFLTRPPGLARDCTNSESLEQLFQTFGFTILRPETLPLEEQIDLFINADVIAGYGGSALLNAVFSDTDKEFIIISPETYNTANEYLIASIFGHNINYFWCDAEVQHKPDRWTWEAFQSPFAFDFEKDGERLKKILSRDPIAQESNDHS